MRILVRHEISADALPLEISLTHLPMLALVTNIRHRLTQFENVIFSIRTYT